MSIAPVAPMHWQMDGISYYTTGLIQAIEDASTDCKIAPYYTIRPDQALRFMFNDNLRQRLGKEFPDYRLCPFLPSVNLPKRFSKGIDIYHATDFLCPRFSGNTAVLATIHDAFALNNLQGMKRTLLRRLKNKFLTRAVKHVDHVFAVSNAIVADIVNYWGVAEKDITVAYPGISEAWFQSANEVQQGNVLQKYNLERGYMLFVGTIQPRKNLARIIAAFNQLPDELQRAHPLVIVGQKGWDYEMVLAKAKELKSNQVGTWLGYVPFNDLKVLYQCASLVLCPSLGEGFGFSIVQGFASKTPVITSNVTSMPEVAQNAALLVDPYSINEIKQAILAILTGQSLRQRCITNGWQRGLAFSWKYCAAKVIDVYKKFL